MTCNACKFEFCWLCMDKFTPDHYNYTRATPCAGKLFSNTNENSQRWFICQAFLTILLVLILPIVLILMLIFIIPIFMYFKKYNEIRIRTIQINGIQPGDNRFVQEDHRKAREFFGCCKLFGWSLVSIVVSPLTLIVFSIPLTIILLIWIILLFVVIYRNVRLLCKSCSSCCSRERN